MDQTAPPPYSEADVFSNTNTTIPTPTSTEADDASRVNGRVRSDSSSTENSLIYTPPYSPTEPDDQHSENNPRNLFPHNYFESRPLPLQFSAPRITQHEIYVTPRSAPEDIPIPFSAPDYGITQQDWSTFVNYLLPNHTLDVNHDVADRKLKAELIDERMHRLTLNEHDYSRLDMNEVQAQLRPLRHPVTASNKDWVGHVDKVIQTWNSGFFLPRGLEILRIDVEQPELLRDRNGNIPGSWIPDEEEPRFPERDRDRRCFLSCYSMSGQGARGFRLGSMVVDDEGLRIGRNGIVANSNGLRIGNMLVADDKGLRIGGSQGVVADENGVSIGGRQFGGRGRGGMQAPEINQGREQDPERWHGRNGWGRGGIHSREANWRWAENPEERYERRGRGRGGPHTRDHHRGGRHESEGYHRGRSQFHHNPHEREQRDHSSSSSSSFSSSSSSSSSTTSLASLPSPDHLPDHQLPAAKESLLAWLHHPEYPTTQKTIQRLRQDIQSAKKNKNKKKNKKNPNPNIANFASTEDLATLRKEVADLLRKFNDEQKSQKTIRKILRKEQRGLKKAHRKERKSTRKAERKGAKKDKKDKKKKEKCNKRDPSHGLPSASIPTYPDVPEIPSAIFPPLPNLPAPSFHNPFLGMQNSSMATMHGGRWPFLSSTLPHPPPHIPPQIPRSSIPLHPPVPSPYAQNSSHIYAQASALLASATANEVEARTLGVVLESMYLNGREEHGDVLERMKKKQEVDRLLEESGESRREGKRLMAEATQMDEEFAREIQEREREGDGEMWAGWLGNNRGQSNGIFGWGT
ncbi:uncharacterized protein EAE97_007085 [Botrytis byssoidea]|uniref:Uncharacterized protein n=1 Tax=Botrytis byssoidea TaxID=139641 RepID=A0A9P5M619_9HELO|nr:uncharacterized protein EAE97_007085 [Botrytis byssoidea]KAF7940900.1 hypothetical protein EAE97_007085 [Botrytis byssoidea]